MVWLCGEEPQGSIRPHLACGMGGWFNPVGLSYTSPVRLSELAGYIQADIKFVRHGAAER